MQSLRRIFRIIPFRNNNKGNKINYPLIMFINKFSKCTKIKRNSKSINQLTLK